MDRSIIDRTTHGAPVHADARSSWAHFAASPRAQRLSIVQARVGTCEIVVFIVLRRLPAVNPAHAVARARARNGTGESGIDLARDVGAGRVVGAHVILQKCRETFDN